MLLQSSCFTHFLILIEHSLSAIALINSSTSFDLSSHSQAITTLWKRLATSEEEQTAFLEAHAGIGDDVIKAVRNSSVGV